MPMHNSRRDAMMDVVYILKDSPSHYDDIELRYSLRSLQHFPHGDVYIVTGKQRGWLTGVKWVRCEDRQCRYQSTKRKILAAAEVLTEPFLFMNDDFYLLAPFSGHDYYCGHLKDKPQTGSKQRDIIQSAIRESRDGLNYSLHSPMILEPKLLKTIRSLAFKDVHGSFSARNKKYMPDVKMRTKKEHDNPEAFISDKPFFSTSDFSFKWIREFMERLYPNPSQYEN